MIKYKFAKNISKILIKILKVVRPTAGTSLPGYFMLKLCPDYFKLQNKNIKEEAIFVTGTNGKTTTSGFLASILNETGKTVLHNNSGANMPQGIASCFLNNDEKPTDYCVMECDEAWLYYMSKSIDIKTLLVTNLFPDQTERYGGVYSLAKRIKAATDKNPNLKIILNADDPHLLSLKNNNTVYFGIEKVENNIKELKPVPEICTCGAVYKYKKRFYSHLGEYKCKACGNKHPEMNYKGNVILSENMTQITVNNEHIFKTSSIGFYNAYNVLAAVSAAMEMGIDDETIQKGLNNYHKAFGRMDKYTVNNKNIIIQLIKNSAGTNQSIKLIKDIKNSILFVALNDTSADGTDISWLYDTEFEYFKDFENEIILSGTRAYELALRFKHAGLSEKQFYIEHNIKSAYKYALKKTKLGENLLILANFTALNELKNIIKR